MPKRLTCIVYGRVQGVSYRAFISRAATDLALTGCVRNLSDGTVEVVAEGDEANLKKLVAILREKHPFAKVERIETTWSEAKGKFDDFRVVFS